MAKGQFLPADIDDAEDITFETDTGAGPKTRADSMLEDLLEELNDTSDNVSLRILRQTGTGKEQMQFVESMAPDKYTADELQEYLRDAYGAGDYRLQVRRNGKIFANRLVSIAAKRNVSRETTGGDNTALLAVLERMDRQDKAMQMMMQQMQNQQQQGGNSKKEFLEEMMIYKQLFADNAPKHTGGFGEIMQTVEGLKGLGINVGLPSPEDKEEGFGDMIDKLSPVLMAAFSGNQNAQPQQAPLQANPNERSPEMMQKMKEQAQLQKLKFGVGQLVNGANKGVDPSVFAELITNSYEQPLVDKYLGTPDAFKMVCQLNPNAGKHEPWFTDLKEHINALYGRPSKFADLYSDFQTDENDAINGETEATTNSETTDNGDNV